MSNDTEFFIVNYDSTNFCQKRLDDYGSKSLMARINLAAHAYLFPNANFGNELKDNVVMALYTSCQSLKKQ